MGRNISSSSVAAAVAGVFNKSNTYGPFGCGQKVSLTVPAGVTQMFATGCAPGGSSGNPPSGAPNFYNLCYDAGHDIYVGNTAAAPANGSISTTGVLSQGSVFNNLSASGSYNPVGTYHGWAFGCAQSGTPFFVSAGTTGSGSTSAGISWSTDGYTWNTLAISGLTTDTCAKQIAVSNDGRAVVLWASGGSKMLTATKDYGNTWSTPASLGAVDANSHVTFINTGPGYFVYAANNTTSPFWYATDPTTTAGWTAITPGIAKRGVSVGWDGTNFIWGYSNGVIQTSATINGAQTARTSNLYASGYVSIVVGSGVVIAYDISGASGSNSTSRSTDNGVTWANCAPSASMNMVDGSIVWSPSASIFVASLNSTYTYYSATGASWSACTTNATTIAGFPSSNASTGWGVPVAVTGGVVVGGRYFAPSVSTSTWQSVNTSLHTLAGISFSTLCDGGNLTITGSTSGALLSLAGGKGNSVSQTSSWFGGNGGGAGSTGGRGALSALLGGSGLSGMGGIPSAAGGPVSFGKGTAGNASTAGQGSMTAGGGTILVATLGSSVFNVKIPGAGGGWSSASGSSNYYLGSGGGSCFSQAPDCPSSAYSSSNTVDANGIGVGSYGACGNSTNNGYGTGGGGEGCYHMTLNVTPGETLTIIVPGRAPLSRDTTATGSLGGPAFLQLEWNQ